MELIREMTSIHWLDEWLENAYYLESPNNRQAMGLRARDKEGASVTGKESQLGEPYAN